MKKILLLICTICLSLSFTYSFVAAEEICVVKVLFHNQDKLEVYSYEDNKFYTIINDANRTTIYNSMTGEEIAFITEERYTEYDVCCDSFISGQVARKLENYLSVLNTRFDYDVWPSSYSLYSYGSYSSGTPDWLTCTVSVLASLLFRRAGLIGTAMSIFITVAQYIQNQNMTKLYYKQYTKSNTYCYILLKSYYDYYKYSNYTSLVNTTTVGHFWTDTPWDYSYPAACRRLVNQYPE